VLDVTLAGWAATIGLIAILFAVDLFVSRPGHAHTVGFRQSENFTRWRALISPFFDGAPRVEHFDDVP